MSQKNKLLCHKIAKKKFHLYQPGIHENPSKQRWESSVNKKKYIFMLLCFYVVVLVGFLFMLFWITLLVCDDYMSFTMGLE